MKKLPPQNHIRMAVARWAETGIYKKMMSDVKLLMEQDGVPIETWTRPTTRENTPLSPGQMMMPMLIAVFGISLSAITFLVERAYSKRSVIKQRVVDLAWQ